MPFVSVQDAGSEFAPCPFCGRYRGISENDSDIVKVLRALIVAAPAPVLR